MLKLQKLLVQTCGLPESDTDCDYHMLLGIWPGTRGSSTGSKGHQ